MEWDNFVMELQNKIRWAISTTYGNNGGTNLPFREAVNFAKEVSGELTRTLKEREEGTGIPEARRSTRRATPSRSSHRNGNGSSRDGRNPDPISRMGPLALWSRGNGPNPQA